MPEQSYSLGSRYELTELIGQGSTGEVWRAWDRQAGRTVAAKLLHRQYAQDADVVARFLRERSILMELHHPRIVKVLDLVVEGDALAIVMEYVWGGTLGQYRRQVGTMPARGAVSVTIGVLEAVAFAHEKGVLHRDIKPDNVLLLGKATPREWSVLLTDFGIARIAETDDFKTTNIHGTPTYMSPELLGAGEFNQASDVYAVGIMLYELLAGRTPFEGGESPVAIGIRHVFSQPPRIPISDELWEVIETSLVKDPDVRLTAAEMLTALRELSPETVRTKALPVQPQPDDWERTPHLGKFSPALDLQFVEEDDESAPVEPVSEQPAITRTGPKPATTLPPAPPAPAEPAAAKPKARKRVGRRVSIGASLFVVVALALLTIWLWPEVLPNTYLVYQPGQLDGVELASGLRVDYQADNGPEPGTVALTMSVSASKLSGLSGFVLLALPPSGNRCPQIEEVGPDSEVLAISQSQDALSMQCGHKAAISLGKGESKQVNLTLSEVETVDLQAWVEDISAATEAGLATISGSDFALQRLSGIRVDAADAHLEGDTPAVVYRVFPVWPDQPDWIAGDPLFTGTTLRFQATDLLLSITGGEGFDLVDVSACPSTRTISNRVIAEQPAETCQIQVRVGAFDVAVADFAIT